MAGYTKEFDCPVMNLGGGGQGGQYLGVKRMRTDDVSVHSPTRVHRATETYDSDSIWLGLHLSGGSRRGGG